LEVEVGPKLDIFASKSRREANYPPSDEQPKIATNNFIEIEDAFDAINVIQIIHYDGDKLFVPKTDFTLEEFDVLLDNLPASAISHLNDFFEDLPYVAVQTEVKCPVCGNTQMVEVRTLEDFFV
jgi:hypothetical protein